jgi:hypothetical protein
VKRPFEDFRFALHEIGSKGEFTPEGAKKAAADFCGAFVALPDAEHMIVVGGYDDDPRELWDIPEARDFVAAFGWAVSGILQRPLHDWKLEPASIALVAVCVGIGRVVRRNPHTGAWIVEIGGQPP